MTLLEDTAAFLLEQRFSQTLFDNIPAPLYPADLTTAYAVQDQLVSTLCDRFGSTPCGYKVACTNERVIELLAVDGPLSGRLLTHSTHEDGAVLDAGKFNRRVMEVEFGFEMASDVPVSNTAYDGESISDFIGDFRPGLEIVDHRFNDFTIVGGKALITENAIHGASIFGKESALWRSQNLVSHEATLKVNGVEQGHGSGANVLGSPLIVMAWLANHLQSRGRQLRAGDLVTTGVACEIYYADAGDTIEADFGVLGKVSMSFT